MRVSTVFVDFSKIEFQEGQLDLAGVSVFLCLSLSVVTGVLSSS